MDLLCDMGHIESQFGPFGENVSVCADGAKFALNVS
jgi:hypothetical protein